MNWSHPIYPAVLVTHHYTKRVCPSAWKTIVHLMYSSFLDASFRSLGLVRCNYTCHLNCTIIFFSQRSHSFFYSPLLASFTHSLFYPQPLLLTTLGFFYPELLLPTGSFTHHSWLFHAGLRHFCPVFVEFDDVGMVKSDQILEDFSDHLFLFFDVSSPNMGQ